MRQRLGKQRAFWSISLTLLFLGCARAADAPPAKDAPSRPANRLAQESSPYLLQHAHNPVDWYPWCPEAFAKAKKEGKLVFLSIGYSSCHWCHVMERESFESAEVAKLMNDWFVCIKVDREERPDIDNIYMTALHVLEIHGGWPLSMFLTAEAKPIIGGTYWPPDDRVIEGETAPGFKSVLKSMHEWQTTKAKRLQDQADKVATATNAALADIVRGTALIELNRSLVRNAVVEINNEFDREYGGFGSAQKRFRGPKFPMPPYLGLLADEILHYQKEIANESTKLSALRTYMSKLISEELDSTLDHMARGGIYDQLGGGFHRYSTERTWTVPHFEKMLYDNAQLTEVYARAFERTKSSLYRRIVQETLAFIAREMTSPDGGFYSALDADSSGSEGLFYVWTDQELQEAIPDKADLALVKKVYGADREPNFESKYHIPVRVKPLEEAAKESNLTEEQLESRLTSLRQKLFERRAQRPRPFLDTKILTGWNGQMIAGYAVAGRVFGEPKYLETAAKSADFILKNLRSPDGRLYRTYNARPAQGNPARVLGYLDDYAFLTHGLLCLHDATREPRWLNEAKALTDTMAKDFGDKESSGFFYTSADHEKLFARTKDQQDNVQPSGNSMAARNLVRLWTRTQDTIYRDLALRTLKTFAGPLKANPTSLPTMAEALALYLDEQDKHPQKVQEKKETQVKGADANQSESKVKITAKAEPAKPGADGKQVVTLTLEIDKGWHTYANPSGLEDAIPTKVTIDSKNKLKEVKVEYPEGKAVKDEVLKVTYRVYEDKVTITATVQRAVGDTGPLEVSVEVQACNDTSCLQPGTKKIKIE